MSRRRREEAKIGEKGGKKLVSLDWIIFLAFDLRGPLNVVAAAIANLKDSTERRKGVLVFHFPDLDFNLFTTITTL